MSDAIKVLLLEHRQIAKVLELIEEQQINVAQHAPMDLRLLETSFDYLSDYPAECHHPKEDLIYRKLLKQIPDLAGPIKNLVEEHWKLAQLTQNLRRAIGESPQNAPLTGESLADQLKVFVDLYRRHMRMEEEQFFPLALQRLTRDDLTEIDLTLFSQPHHFSLEMQGRFAELHHAITRMGIADRTRTHHRDEAVLLANCQDIAAFNEAMRGTGEKVFLSRAKDGYELECEGNSIVHIPECSQSRAAWCAYFFWKATAMARAIP